jgi:outer membrane beta-barrel protein
MTVTRVLFVLIVAFALTTIGPAPALAQDDGGATIVPTRAPDEKRVRLVRNKFFLKAGRVEITPTGGLITDNPLNNEFYGGVAATFHFDERIGLEIMGAYSFPGSVGASSATGNSKPLARAVLRLKPGLSIESTDPGALVSASAVFTPMYGKINPFGSAVINLDFYLLVGLGYANENIELLGMNDVGQVVLFDAGVPPQVNHLFEAHLGLGMNIYLTRWLSAKVDARLHVLPDEVLDFDDPSAASDNKDNTSLDPSRVPGAGTRLDCHDATATGAICKLSPQTWFIVNFGVSFWAPGDKVVRNRKTRR